MWITERQWINPHQVVWAKVFQANNHGWQITIATTDGTELTFAYNSRDEALNVLKMLDRILFPARA